MDCGWCTFLEHLPGRLRAEGRGRPALAAAWEEALHRARLEWPDLSVSDEAFATYLAGKLGRDGSLEQSLADLRIGDLYLAFACASGDQRAMERFETCYLREVDGALIRMRGQLPPAEDVRQMVRERLLVAPHGRGPRIGDFNGRGDLRTWVRVAVTRTLLNLVARDNRETPAEDEALLEVPSSPLDPEIQHLKRHYRAEVKAAFGEALVALSSRERNLLRHRFVDGLMVEQIAAIYGVHQATVARWLAKAKEDLSMRLRRLLAERFRVPADELNSVLRLVQSQLDVSLSRVLKVDAED